MLTLILPNEKTGAAGSDPNRQTAALVQITKENALSRPTKPARKSYLLMGVFCPKGVDHLKGYLEMPLMQISNADQKGWLLARFTTREVVALPWRLKVDFIRLMDGRDHFRIVEGPYAGREASSPNSGSSYLEALSHGGAATLRFRKSAREIHYGSGSMVAAYTDAGDAVPNGRHEIEIPDFPHPGGEGYENRSAYAKSWFRIGNSGARYLHCGEVSAGCATVTDIAGWTGLYLEIIGRRSRDGVVGHMIVED
jgi:hypothetical protein